MKGCVVSPFLSNDSVPRTVSNVLDVSDAHARTPSRMGACAGDLDERALGLARPVDDAVRTGEGEGLALLAELLEQKAGAGGHDAAVVDAVGLGLRSADDRVEVGRVGRGADALDRAAELLELLLEVVGDALPERRHLGAAEEGGA